MKNVYIVIVFCVLSVASARAGEGAEIDSVLRAVVANNLQLRALAHDNAAELLDLKSDGVLSAPSIEYSPFFQGGKRGVQMSELIVSQQFDFPTIYVGKHRKVRLQSSLLDGRYLVAKREVLLQARLLCIDIICQNQIVDMLDRRLNESESVLKLLERRLDAGDANILELNKSKLELMNVKQLKAQAEGDRLALLRQLQELNGGKPVTLSQTVFPERELDADLESFVHRTVSADASVIAAGAGVDAARHDVALSRQSWLPALTVGYRRNMEGTERFNGMIVGASFPLFSTRSRIRAAKERNESARIQLDDARLQAETETRMRYEELQRIRVVLDHTDVALLLQTLTLLQSALQHGELTALQYYTETTSIYDKLQIHIELHHKYTRLMAELYRNE